MDMDGIFLSERLKTASLKDLQQAFAEAARKLIGESNPLTCRISTMDFTRWHSVSMTLTLGTTWPDSDEATGQSDTASG